MAAISKNGGEIIRLTRVKHDADLGSVKTTLVFCANGAVLRKRHIVGQSGAFKHVGKVRNCVRNPVDVEEQSARIRAAALNLNEITKHGTWNVEVKS